MTAVAILGWLTAFALAWLGDYRIESARNRAYDLRQALMDAEEDAALYRAQRDDLLDSLQRLTGSTNHLLSALERPIIVPPAGGMVA
jgi:hypothetical protein